MSGLAEPHAGILVDRFAAGEDAAALQERARRLPRITLDEREEADLELIATGAASPLTGFLGARDYRSVLDSLTLADGTPWPVPLTLAVTIPQMASVLQHRAGALHDGDGRLRGIIEASDVFVRNPRGEALALYGTDDEAHPGVAYLLSRPSGLVGGRVTVLRAPAANGRPRSSSPREIRALARLGQWSGVAGLATAEGDGCLEPAGTAQPILLRSTRVAVRQSPGRDALLQAIVLKNHGAREVFLDCGRDDWLAVSRRFEPEALGVMPVWLVGPAARRALWRGEPASALPDKRPLSA